MKKYSGSINGFFDDAIHGVVIPSDAVDVTDVEYSALFLAQSNGKLIKPDANGKPVASDYPPPSLADVKSAKLASLEKSRKAASTANVTAMGKTFRADMETQTDFKRLGDRLRRGKPTKLTAILDANGNQVNTVNQALMDAIEDAIADNTETAWNHYGALVAQVNAATDAATVNAIVW